jgi:hypothetical protein
MSLSAAAAATQILSNAFKALDSLREQAKGSKDTALKENISKLYDALLDLKAVVIRVEDENGELRRRIAQQANSEGKPEIRTVGLVNYYFVGDAGPYCQPCYDRDKRLVMLGAQQEYFGGTGRKCEVCDKVFFEKRKSGQHQLRVHRS